MELVFTDREGPEERWLAAGGDAEALVAAPVTPVTEEPYVLRLHFPASNNVAEYEALVNGLRIAIELGVRRLDARGDSQLVTDQVMKNSHCRDPKMEAYCDEVRCLEDKFYGLELNHYQKQLEVNIDRASIDTILDKYLCYYPKQFRFLLKERIETVLMEHTFTLVGRRPIASFALPEKAAASSGSVMK